MKRKNIPTHKHITENKSINILLHHITDSDLQNISDNEKFSTLKFVKNEYKEIFNRLPFLSMNPRLSQEELYELLQCISLVNKKQAQTNELAGQNILHDLVSAYIGMMAEIYQKSFPAVKNNRYMEITSEFKTIFSANYQTMKRPNQYASQMRISSIYLNEAVKTTTGFSVSDCIQNEIVIQAKRLLYSLNFTYPTIYDRTR